MRLSRLLAVIPSLPLSVSLELLPCQGPGTRDQGPVLPAIAAEQGSSNHESVQGSLRPGSGFWNPGPDPRGERDTTCWEGGAGFGGGTGCVQCGGWGLGRRDGNNVTLWCPSLVSPHNCQNLEATKMPFCRQAVMPAVATATARRQNITQCYKALSRPKKTREKRKQA